MNVIILSEISPDILLGIIFGVLGALLLFFLILFITRYKKCPSDKIMVIYGKLSPNKDGSVRTAKCIHGGAVFIVPFVQAYAFLDLNPINAGIMIEDAASGGGRTVTTDARFSFAVSTKEAFMQVAAERLLALTKSQIEELGSDIIYGQFRSIIETTDFSSEDFNINRFHSEIINATEVQLNLIGLTLINTKFGKININ